jgi:hypothetical protein
MAMHTDSVMRFARRHDRISTLRRWRMQHEINRKWGYFCQISASTTGSGSYPGAVPDEKMPGASWMWRHPAISSSPTPPSSHR